jgi:SAM-dependent methyltransferase
MSLPPAPGSDIVAYYGKFFNVLGRLVPWLEDLHYGITPADAPPGLLALPGRLAAGPRRLLARVAEVAGMDAWAPSTRGLDVGCGLAGTSMYLAERFGFAMTGINVNAEQLLLAGDRVRRRGLEARVVLQLGDARDLPLPDASADLAILIEVAFHVRDKARLFAELRRVLRPGGTIVLVDQEQAADLEVMGLFFFPGFGGYAALMEAAGLRVERTVDLSADVARWMADYAAVAGLPAHALAVAAALARGEPRLGWRYLRGAWAVNRRIVDDPEVRRRAGALGLRAEPGWAVNGVKLLRLHTRDVLASGRSRYQVQIGTRP